jgi:hypothetical protein
MPRRRMLDPSFTDDPEVAQLTMVERVFLVGCLRNSDDEGRLQGHISFLRSNIFMYDDIEQKQMLEIKESTLEKMTHWRRDNKWLLRAYKDGDQDYIYFVNWYETNKPSHPSPSVLPAPPPEQLTNSNGHSPEPIQSSSGETLETIPNHSVESQVSQVKGSIGKAREVQEDFHKYLNNETDLTDFLKKTLMKYMSAGRDMIRQEPEVTPERERAVAAQWGMPVLNKFWEQATGGKLSGAVWQGAYSALQQYPADIVALAFVKAGPYGGGKHKSWKYIQTIIDEEMEKHARSPLH